MVSQMMPFGERRLHERKSCSRMISINDSQGVYTGHMRDLALGGAFIEPSDESESSIGEELILTIPFGLRPDHIQIKAKVAWTQPCGIGVRFIKPGGKNRLL
jgi:Tfp pilus assembly protein PilZ